MKQLLGIKEEGVLNHCDSLDVSFVAKSHLVIATTQNENVENPYTLKKSILLMKVNIADI